MATKKPKNDVIQEGWVVHHVNEKNETINCEGPYESQAWAERVGRATLEGAARRLQHVRRGTKARLKEPTSTRIERRKVVPFSKLQRLCISNAIARYPELGKVQFGDVVKEYIGIGWIDISAHEKPHAGIVLCVDG